MSQLDLLMDGISRAIATKRPQTALAWLEHSARIAEDNGWHQLALELDRLRRLGDSGELGPDRLNYYLHQLRQQVRRDGVR